MQAQTPLTAILLIVALLLGAYLLMHQAELDLAGPLRDWLNARDARRMDRRHRFPERIRRTYWNDREYERDRDRLLAIGYAIEDEEATEPYVELPSFPGRPPPRRRVPRRFVIYHHD